jgi:putative ABC transport system ATP-binding protein
MSLLGSLSRDERRSRSASLLRLVGLQDRGAHLPSELSGGEQQRVAIARALANSPELLLLDEPTGDLDTRNTVVVMDTLLKLNREKGITLIMTTHNPDLECYADRIIFMADGRIVGQAINSVQSTLDSDFYAQYLHREADDEGEGEEGEEAVQGAVGMGNR